MAESHDGVTPARAYSRRAMSFRTSSREIELDIIALRRHGACVAGWLILAGCAPLPMSEPAQVDAAPSARVLKKLPRKDGERVAVTIYEFRSSVSEIPARGSTDMFKTALVQSGQFRVVERARLNEGVAREKQLNAAGASSGKAASTQLRGAQYIIEGTISEANPGQNQRSGSIGIAGAEFGGGTNKDVIGIDVRIVDAGTGDVLDAISVRKTITGDSINVAGIGNLLNTVLAQQGRSSAYTPDVRMTQQRRQSLDDALRAAINQAVLELANRF